MSDEAGVVVLARVTWRQLTLPPGSVVIMANCGHRGWSDPSTQAFLAGDGAGWYTQCTQCFDLERIAIADDMSMGYVPGASSTLLDYGVSDSQMKWIFQQVKRKGFGL